MYTFQTYIYVYWSQIYIYIYHYCLTSIFHAWVGQLTGAYQVEKPPEAIVSVLGGNL